MLVVKYKGTPMMLLCDIMERCYTEKKEQSNAYFNALLLVDIEWSN